MSQSESNCAVYNRVFAIFSNYLTVFEINLILFLFQLSYFNIIENSSTWLKENFVILWNFGEHLCNKSNDVKEMLWFKCETQEL